MTTQPTVLSRESNARAALVAWGVVLIVAGVLVGLVGIAATFGMMGDIERRLLSSSQRIQRTAMPAISVHTVLGLIILLIAAALLIWTGIGSFQTKRWVRPIVMIFSVLIIIYTLLELTAFALSLPTIVNALDQASQRNRNVVAPSSVISIWILRMGIMIALGVILPYIIFRTYARKSTADLLDEFDARVLWTDRCAPLLLGWAMFALIVGLAALIQLIGTPRVPAFITVLTGGPAIVAWCIVGIALPYGAWLCYRRDRMGWLITFLLLVCLRAATATCLWTGTSADELVSIPTSASERIRPGQSTKLPDWIFATVASLELIIVVGVGLAASRHVFSSHRVGVIA